MKAEQIVRDAEVLLAQMAEYPHEIGAALAPEERQVLLQAFPALTARAAAVKNEAELLEVAEALQRLVEETPGLRNLLLPKDMNVAAAREERKVTIADYQATTGQGQHVQARAAQVRNAVIEVQARLKAALRDDRRQSAGR